MEKERQEKDEKIAEAEKENAGLNTVVRDAEERVLDVQAEAKIIETAKLAYLIKFKKLDDKGINFYIDRFLKLDSMAALEALATGGRQMIQNNLQLDLLHCLTSQKVPLQLAKTKLLVMMPA
ncbi:uncharacterized protein LOC130589616 [Beta vulgaris subsp. vulgaris]|uniref:uncharacterized protein LOC130589616 n=1 Tax=Beta vulgaris subsp. vulgaris TaxID=3555 RepID=UPI00254820AF|nr:uncharacterized protein LOC130589616 [Beta vulgaris subsp. vulgaris]